MAKQKDNRYAVEWSEHMGSWIVTDEELVDEVAVTGNWEDAETIRDCLNAIEYERIGNE